MGFISIHNDIWANILNNKACEIYQHPDFVKLDAKLIGGTPIAWYDETDEHWLLLPLIKRRIPDKITNGKDYYDLISPYGYPGILYSSYLALNYFLPKFSTEAWKEGYISTFIRLNPFLNPVLIHENDDLVQVVHGKIVTINMKIPHDDRYMKYSSQKRRDIKNLVKQGFKVTWNEWDKLDSFISIYNETMDRQEADNYYYFSKDYYEKLIKLNKEHFGVELVLCKNDTDQVVAGSFFINNGKYMQYHLSGTHKDYLQESPINLIFDEVFKKYCGKLDYFNLGGGVGNKTDSLFKFKERFGKEYCKFSTLRLVNDRQRYNNLCQDYKKEELYDLARYFPLYRK